MTPCYSTNDIKALIDQYQRSPEFLELSDSLMEQPASIKVLTGIAVSDDVYPYPQYASHLLLHVSWKNHFLIQSSYNKLIDCILTTRNISVQRNLLGVIINFPLREYKEGELLEFLFALVNDPKSKPGQVNYAVRKLAQYIERYPELLNELEVALELREQMGASLSIVAWSKTVLKKKKK